MSIELIREQFPILKEKVYGKPLVYLDNAATSQRPLAVAEKWLSMTAAKNANIHRAVHKLAAEATDEYEAARDAVREYLNAEERESIVFTSGTTAGINLVAFSFGEACVGQGDEIIVSESEHHSNIVPWQMMCQRKGAKLKVLPVDERGCLDLDVLKSMLGEKTKLVAVTHISNVLGVINPVKEIVSICHSMNCPVLLDGAQGIVHQQVDVSDIDCDFYVFSGHKIYAAPGTGVLYAKREWLEKMPPYMGGGEMIQTVKFSGTSYNAVPYKFEAGTQNLAGVPTLTEALKFAKSLWANDIESYCEEIKDYVWEALIKRDDITLYGNPENKESKIALFSFSVKGVHHEDLALLLDKMGIAVRSGQMCAEPLMDRFGVTGMVRASFAPYNTKQEAEYFINCLDKAIKMLV